MDYGKEVLSRRHVDMPFVYCNEDPLIIIGHKKTFKENHISSVTDIQFRKGDKNITKKGKNLQELQILQAKK